MNARLAICLLLVALGACSNTPPRPDWQLQAHDSHQRATQAYLEGRLSKSTVQVHQVEWQRANATLSSTARPELLARLELAICATQLAALDSAAMQSCPAYERWSDAALAAERAYAAYLRGKPAALELAVLPQAHQTVARAMLADMDTTAALRAIADPLAKLVASAAALQAGQLSPSGIDVAVETASAQGWRRPLAAWLAVQERQASAAGDTLRAKQAQARLKMLLP